MVDHRGITSNQLIEEIQKLGWMIFYHEQDKRAKRGAPEKFANIPNLISDLCSAQALKYAPTFYWDRDQGRFPPTIFFYQILP